MQNLTTVENNRIRKIKTVEVQYSNMTFIVQAYSHYITTLRTPYWTKTQYSATIKETGEGIGIGGRRKTIKSQMELINSRPDLFL